VELASFYSVLIYIKEYEDILEEKRHVVFTENRGQTRIEISHVVGMGDLLFHILR
jgi:hypothetical protein